MPVITVSNLKGGVGKTSTCMHLGGMLARNGHRVLLVDDDPQSSLTQGLWGPAELTSLPRSSTIFEVYDGWPQPEQVVHPTAHANLSLLPGHDDAIHWNEMPRGVWGEHQDRLGGLLDTIRGEYDYIIIDTAPNLSLCTHTALCCSDWVLVPLQPEDFGAQGTAKVNRAVEKARSFNPGLNVLGYVLSQYNGRLKIHQDFERTIRVKYPHHLFDTCIPDAVDFKEAVTLRLPINQYKKSGKAFDAIHSLAQEMEFRIRMKAVAA